MQLIATGPVMTKNEALKLEYRIKQLPAHEKVAELTKNEKHNDNYEKEIRSLQGEIEALKNKIDKLISAVGKRERHGPTKGPP